MKQHLIFLCLIYSTMTNAKEKNSIQSTIINLETEAFVRWIQGDPTGFLEISAPDVVYFDPFQERRLNGIEELAKLYLPMKGQFKADNFAMLDPVVQTAGKMAVLTFNFESRQGEKVQKWNCTEVYRFEADETWKICQTHWSLTKPELK
ncbi:MAG TPA: nuclear transport factor 2 family protein [Prolixibacteraceae bacterium]|nr:nuclear transport factor 2 family protein [Prolixibacteraceae bacterium]